MWTSRVRTSSERDCFSRCNACARVRMRWGDRSNSRQDTGRRQAVWSQRAIVTEQRRACDCPGGSSRRRAVLLISDHILPFSSTPSTSVNCVSYGEQLRKHGVPHATGKCGPPDDLGLSRGGRRPYHDQAPDWSIILQIHEPIHRVVQLLYIFQDA